MGADDEIRRGCAKSTEAPDVIKACEGSRWTTLRAAWGLLASVLGSR
jgi:hypothetical protein